MIRFFTLHINLVHVNKNLVVTQHSITFYEKLYVSNKKLNWCLSIFIKDHKLLQSEPLRGIEGIGHLGFENKN